VRGGCRTRLYVRGYSLFDEAAGVDGGDDEDEDVLESDVEPPLSLLFDSVFADGGALSLADDFPFCE
jgi:hypothetical protein